MTRPTGTTSFHQFLNPASGEKRFLKNLMHCHHQEPILQQGLFSYFIMIITTTEAFFLPSFHLSTSLTINIADSGGKKVSNTKLFFQSDFKGEKKMFLASKQDNY